MSSKNMFEKLVWDKKMKEMSKEELQEEAKRYTTKKDLFNYLRKFLKGDSNE